MNKDRFLDIIEAYGSDPRRWPAAERDDALALVRSDAELAVVLREADRLDALLDESRPLAPSLALRSRVIAGAPRGRAAPRRFGWWAPGAGLAAAGVAGVVFGASLLAPPETSEVLAYAELESYETLVDPAEGQF